MDVVEFGNEFGFLAVPVMKQRRDDAARLKLLVKPDVVIHLQRRGVIGASARHLIEKILVRELLDQQARDALFGKLERQAQAHRTRADDQDAIARPIHEALELLVQAPAGAFSLPRITSLTDPTPPLSVMSKTIASRSRYLHSYK